MSPPSPSRSNAGGAVLTRVPTKGDGACMFRSLATALAFAESGTVLSVADETKRAAELREAVVNYIETHPKDAIIDPEVRSRKAAKLTPSQFRQEYITRMRMPSTWGGETELRAAARVLNRDINVYNAADGVMKLVIDSPTTSKRQRSPLHILHQGEVHYSALLPATPGSAAASNPRILGARRSRGIVDTIPIPAPRAPTPSASPPRNAPLPSPSRQTSDASRTRGSGTRDEPRLSVSSAAPRSVRPTSESPAARRGTTRELIRKTNAAMQVAERNVVGGEGSEGVYGSIGSTDTVRILQAMGLTRKDTLVDAGCGLGRPLVLANAVCGVRELHGFDVDRTKINKAVEFCRSLRDKGVIDAVPHLVHASVGELLAGRGLPRDTTAVYAFIQGWSPADRTALGALFAACPTATRLAIVGNASALPAPNGWLQMVPGAGQLRILNRFPVRAQGGAGSFTASVLERLPASAPLPRRSPTPRSPTPRSSSRINSVFTERDLRGLFGNGANSRRR